MRVRFIYNDNTIRPEVRVCLRGCDARKTQTSVGPAISPAIPKKVCARCVGMIGGRTTRDPIKQKRDSTLGWLKLLGLLFGQTLRSERRERLIGVPTTLRLETVLANASCARNMPKRADRQFASPTILAQWCAILAQDTIARSFLQASSTRMNGSAIVGRELGQLL